MRVIDVQVHPYERDHPGRPWAGEAHGLPSASGEEMVAAMDAVGVDAAVMVSSFNLYKFDPSYALEVYAKYPDRFRVVTPIDATDPAIDDVVAKWAATPGARGVRIILRDTLEELTAFGDGGRQPGLFYGVHSLAVDSKGNLYTTETYEGKRLQKRS